MKCKAVAAGIEDIWCQRQCSTDAGAGCPKQDCVCDWSGDWPDDDKYGFANWDLGSLGIPSATKADDSDDGAAAAADVAAAAPGPAEAAAPAAAPDPVPDDAAKSCKSIRDDATDEWCAQTCKHGECPSSVVDACKCGAEADKARKEQEEQAAEDAKCTMCGEGNNCCGLGGSWAGQCPGLHSYGEGHDTCLKIMEISGKSSQHNGDDDAASAQEAPAKEAAAAAPAAEPVPAAPAPAEPAPIAAEPGPMPDDAAQSCKSIRDDATDEWCAQTCKHGECPPGAELLCSCGDEADKAQQGQEEQAAAPANCTVCGEGNNCCGLGGSWAGTCPGLHSYGEGHDACRKVMKASDDEGEGLV